jgi:hypothetical protein
MEIKLTIHDEYGGVLNADTVKTAIKVALRSRNIIVTKMEVSDE